MTKTMLNSKLLDLLTDAQKKPYLFELLKGPITAAQADPQVAWSLAEVGRWHDDACWFDLEDARIIDQLPSGTFEVDRRNGIIWVCPA
jgi:hypothetical protein